jgi:predicted MFS family arabinose efflux permease
MAVGALRSGVRGYQALLSPPSVRRVVGWGLVARLPMGMMALALVLLIRSVGGSYEDAGIANAANAVAAGLGAPLGGRMVDRHGPGRVLMVYAVVHPSLITLLLVLALTHAPLASIVIAAGAVGFAFPPIGPTIRSMWPRLIPRDELHTAFALEATLQEVIFVSGPLLVGAITALVSASAGILVTAVLSAVGVTVLARTSQIRNVNAQSDHERRRSHLLAAAAPPGVRRILTFSAGLGIAFGAVEVAMPAFAEGHGGRSLGALALAAWSGGSLVGGVLAASRPAADLPQRLRKTSAAFVAVLFLPLLAHTMAVMTIVMFIAGLPIAPSFAVAYGLVERSALPNTQAEVFGWISTAITAGVALGTAGGGSLISHSGSTASIMLGICGAAVACGIALLPRPQPTAI